LVLLTNEIRALSCKQPLPSFPESDLRHGSATDAPRGGLHPFRSGQILNPYAVDYRPPFAFSAIPYPLPQQLALRLACLASLPKPRQGIGLTTFLELPTSRRAAAMPFRLGSVSPGAAHRATYSRCGQEQPGSAPFWLWPDSRFGHSVVTRVQLAVHFRYPCGISLAPRPPSCWQSPYAPSREAHAIKVGDVVGRASHRTVTSLACRPRQLLVAQQVTA